MPFDRIDRHILTLLQSDGRISNSELADAVGLLCELKPWVFRRPTPL